MNAARLLARRTAAQPGPRLVRNMATPKRMPADKPGDVSKAGLSEPASYPILGVIGAALFLSAYKMFHDATGPEAHFSKHERGTIDYVENERDAAAVASYASHRNPAAQANFKKGGN